MTRRALSLPILFPAAALLLFGQLAGTAPVAASSRPSLGPLRQALALLSSSRPLSIRTSVSIDNNVRKCDRVTYRKDVQITSLRPGYFRAVVTSQGARLKPYVVFLNNGKVWIYYRPDLRQYYAESGHGKLEYADWRLGIANALRNLSRKSNASILSSPALAHAGISEHTEGGSSGKELVYTLNENSEELRFFIRAASNTLDRIEWHTVRYESSYSVTEEIGHVSPISPTSESKFTLPPGAVNKSFPLP